MTEKPDTPAPDTKNSGNSLGRIALAAAAIIALGSAGYAFFNRDAKDSPPAATQAVPEQDIASAITSLEAKLKENPKDANGWRMLGWSLFETGKFAESAQAYRRATQLAPEKGEYWSSLGESLTLAGNGTMPADAKAAFAKAIEIDPKDPRARYFLGVSKDMAGDHKGAIADWLALLKDTPSGAPWEADVRRVITDVAKKEGMQVALPAATGVPQVAATGALPGATIATSAIPGPSAADMKAAASMPKGQQDLMIQGMVEGLEKKLVANPDNVNGWIMLLRSRTQLGETAKASKALADARAAFASNPQKIGMINAAADELGVK
jgi:cytochrome c-type biogenesis protein CcmH